MYIKVIKVFIISIFLYSCSQTQKETENKENISNDSMLKRGEYLVTIMACADCHSPKMKTDQGFVPDPDLTLSGHPSHKQLKDIDTSLTRTWAIFSKEGTASAGPWGVSYAANITSDPTGIGGWTQEQFNRAMKQGKYKGIEKARTLQPPMPWPSFAVLTEEDLKAIFTFLKSTKPVRNVPPDSKSRKDINK
ncbi:MAG: c-type cytochrome [Sporocytophaga sp.]|uniref:c-type cytochrome n=1 Tax=Sporocytophaga sp. TaxID=2231183 RepID=UPI001B13FD3C|nr:c-type cytochrome [Sporocytophaga sp.]MBO9702180.1 c-type cytochrome [Sporocytophaga sp.]